MGGATCLKLNISGLCKWKRAGARRQKKVEKNMYELLIRETILYCTGKNSSYEAHSLIIITSLMIINYILIFLFLQWPTWDVGLWPFLILASQQV